MPNGIARMTSHSNTGGLANQQVYEPEAKAWFSSTYIRARRKEVARRKSPTTGDEAEPMDETNGGAQA
ncbi:hypothetical protein Tco_0993928 [Tanacetum coccineum]